MFVFLFLFFRLQKAMKVGSQLPDYFKRIHYSSDEEMVDGYKIVELFTQNTEYDIRRLHTIFCNVLTVDLTILMLLVEEKRKRRDIAPGYNADGTPSKDVFVRLEKVENEINATKNQKFFYRRRNVVVFMYVLPLLAHTVISTNSIHISLRNRAMTPKVVRNAWEAPVEVDVRPFVDAAIQRIIETATAVVRCGAYFVIIVAR